MEQARATTAGRRRHSCRADAISGAQCERARGAVCALHQERVPRPRDCVGRAAPAPDHSRIHYALPSRAQPSRSGERADRDITDGRGRRQADSPSTTSRRSPQLLRSRSVIPAEPCGLGPCLGHYGLLEEAHIKLSSLVSDLLGSSARRMLRALASGETDPATIAALGSARLHATAEQLCDALGAATDLHPLYRRLLAMTLAELEVIETHMQQLDEELAGLLRAHQDAVQRLAAVPGLGVDSAQQIIAEVGPTAETFSTAKRLASWVGACPGHDESAGINHSHRSPNGNRQMRRLLNQAAHAAV